MPSKTGGEISQALCAAVQARLRDPGAQVWKTEAIYTYLNEAQDVVATELPDAALMSLAKIRSLPWVNGQSFYSFPVDCLRVRHVAVNGVEAVRVQLLDVDALRVNPNWQASLQRPKYVISAGGITFYTGNQDPPVGNSGIQLYYLRKPMRTRQVVTATTSTTALTVKTSSGVTDVAVGDPVGTEGILTATGRDLTGTYDVTAVVSPTELRVSKSGLTVGTDLAVTEGRLILLKAEQLSDADAPDLSPLLFGLMMNYAVMRCQEQGRNFGEAMRQSNHFKQRLEFIKQRYTPTRPADRIAGDPAQRVAGGQA
ncbi:MAG: phage adaptor protein [Armatimonadota bacterium]